MRNRTLLLVLIATAGAAAQSPRVAVEGLVTDALDEPIPAVRVEAWANGIRVALATADGEGIYQLGRLPETGAELRFSASGKANYSVLWRGITRPRVCSVRLEDGCSLRGSLTDEHGLPLAGASVVVIAGLQTSRTTSDVQGHYELTALPMRPAVVRALSIRGAAECCLRLTGDATCDLTIAPHTGGEQLVCVQGLPEASRATASLRVFSSEMARLPNQGRFLLREDNTAQLLLREPALVAVDAEGFTSTPDGHVVQRSTTMVAFDLAPTPAHRRTTIRGRVQTTDNRAVAGQRLVVRDRSNVDLCSTVVDGTGQFQVVVPMPAGTFCRFGLELRGWHLVDGEVHIADGFSWRNGSLSETHSTDLLVEPTSPLRSTLQTKLGAQFAFAEVIATNDETPHRAFVRTRSDRTGRIALDLPAGEYHFLAVTRDGQVAQARVRVHRGQREVECRWTPVQTGEIAGRLLDQQNQPVAGVELFLASTALQDNEEVSASERLSCRIWTDRLGRYRGRGLPCGTWTVVGIRRDVVEERVDVAADTVHALDLRQR